MNAILVTFALVLVCVTAVPSNVCRHKNRLYSSGQQWRTIDGRASCRCGYQYYAGRRGRTVEAICKWEGCKMYDGAFYRPGEILVKDDRSCMCVPGTDPYLADASTRFHFKCNKGHIPVEIGA